MNKSISLIPVMFAIFALMLSPAVMSVSADTENNGRDKGTKNANGCDKGKAKDAGHNPNCHNNNDSDGDGIPNELDVCPNQVPKQTLDGEPDHDGDGMIDSLDLETICV